MLQKATDAAHAFYSLLPSEMSKRIARTIHSIERANYRTEALPLPKYHHGTRYYTYDLVGAKSDAMLERFLELTEKRDLAYDIGAYIGAYGLAVASSIDGCKVVACEPNPQSYTKLEKNIKATGVKDSISPLHVGIGNSSQKLQFFKSDPPVRSSFSKEEASAGGGHNQRQDASTNHHT
jgi:predicted O-methyltransferase YrrM